MQAYCSTPNLKPRRRISSAINKLSLSKMRELVSPSAPTSHKPVSSGRHSESKAATAMPESPSQLPFPTLRPNSKTMKNYAVQRSDKIPLRVPASFPTSLNFSQQTIYLFDSSEDQDDNNLNYYLDDILHGPTELKTPGDCLPAKTHTPRVKQRSFHLPGSHHGQIKTKKLSFNAFPLRKSISFQVPGKTGKKSGAVFPRNVDTRSLPAKLASDEFVNARVLNKSDVHSTEITRCESRSSDDSKSSRKRLMSLPTKLDSTYFSTVAEFLSEDTQPGRLSDIPEHSQPPTPVCPSLNCETMAEADGSGPSLPMLECPRINMILSSSPLFNEGHSTLSAVARSTPSTPSSPFSLTHPHFDYPFQALMDPETPSTCVDSCRATYPATPYAKFLMSTGSPGLFNFPYPAPQQTPSRRQLSLLSPHPLPSPLAAHPTPLPNPSRGPGPDMLATLEFLSDLCHKSPDYLDDHDSLFDHASSIGDSTEP